eukprot:789534-Pyramimonas_sp.AAC.1
MTCDGSRARNRGLVSTLRRHASQSTASCGNALTITHSAEVQKNRFNNSGLRNACTASCDNTLTITYSIILQARSRLRTGRAWGPDGISVELLKSLSWRSVRAIGKVFSDIFNGLRPTPREWQE